MARGYAIAACLLTSCAALLAPIAHRATTLHSSVKEMSDMMREQRKLMEEDEERSSSCRLLEAPIRTKTIFKMRT